MRPSLLKLDKNASTSLPAWPSKSSKSCISAHWIHLKGAKVEQNLAVRRPTMRHWAVQAQYQCPDKVVTPCARKQKCSPHASTSRQRCKYTAGRTIARHTWPCRAVWRPCVSHWANWVCCTVASWSPNAHQQSVCAKSTRLWIVLCSHDIEFSCFSSFYLHKREGSYRKDTFIVRVEQSKRRRIIANFSLTSFKRLACRDGLCFTNIARSSGVFVEH